MRAEEIKEEIYRTIDMIVAARIKEMKRMDYFEAVVQQKNKNGTYEVSANGGKTTVYSINDDTYSIGDVVIILKFSVYSYILTKKNAIVL